MRLRDAIARLAATAELLAALRKAAGREPEVLSREEEGRLAFLGAVVDFGGASTEVAVGRPHGDVAWVRSFDLGALRLTTRLLAEEKPTLRRLARARPVVAAELGALTPPLAGEGRAVGGCARALRKVVGETLGAAELEEAVGVLARLMHDEIADEYGVRPDRATLLVAGAIVLAEVQARLVVPLAVVDGAVREGALLDDAADAEERVA